MAKRITETERITAYFMETDLAVAEAQLNTIRAIVASRQKLASNNGTAAPAPKATRRSRKPADIAIGAPEVGTQQSALDAAL